MGQSGKTQKIRWSMTYWMHPTCYTKMAPEYFGIETPGGCSIRFSLWKATSGPLWSGPSPRSKTFTLSTTTDVWCGDGCWRCDLIIKMLKIWIKKRVKIGINHKMEFDHETRDLTLTNEPWMWDDMEGMIMYDLDIMLSDIVAGSCLFRYCCCRCSCFSCCNFWQL